ncbi:MAG TPA: flavin reductase family protein [Acidimicrobiales bacterium]|nr:flavin reductase family protein [Acidimicrobiales bacterium]
MVADPGAPGPPPEADASAGDGPPVDAARFRQVLGHFATGVTVVTGLDTAGPVGLAVNSFTSVSLDPPLVAISVNRTSSTWPRIRTSGRFTVNILSADQEAVSRRFASGGDRFEGVGWRRSPSGSPVLDGALAWIDATVEAEHDAGDHLLVVGRVSALDVVGAGGPLVFYRGGYGRFDP